MRRLMGAWLLFLLVLATKSGLLVRGFRGDSSPQTLEAVFSSPARIPENGSASDSQSFANAPSTLPTWYCSDPLFFFSTAPRDSLILLPGIGPVLADRIIDARGGKRLFKSWDDLLRVKGIGAKTVEKFKRLADAD
jgi:hypothetical protein